MQLELIDGSFSICKLKDAACIDLTAPFLFFARTDEELSLVCPAASVPADAAARDDGWRALRVCGTLDFSLVGVLAALSAVLAAQGISLFALSTFNTDYLLVREACAGAAVDALTRAGYTVHSQDVGSSH